jgi:predicted small lipoprotein YifL
MKATRFGGHPDFLQRLLQVDDDLAAVCKGQGDHAARTLVVDIGIGVIVDAVACQLNSTQGVFCVVKIFKVGHYNPVMVALFKIFQILGRLHAAFLRHGLAVLLPAALLGLTGLSGCGQKGPLFIPVPPVAAAAAPPVMPAALPAAVAPASSAR